MTVDKDAVGCPGCDYDPLALELDVHFGSMISARQAMLGAGTNAASLGVGVNWY